MFRKSIAVFTLGAFLLLTWACSSQSLKTLPAGEVKRGKDSEPILAVQKKSGERIEFAREGPGRYDQGSVVGNVWAHVELDKSQIKNTRTDPGGRVTGVTMKGGQSYELKSVVMIRDKISGLGLQKVSVPVSEVDLIWIRKTNSAGSAVASVLFIGAATFWLLDSLAVDYTPDLPLNAVELSPIKAVDRLGRDARDELALQDGLCYVMAKNGHSAEITFLAPPQNPAMARSLILEASGYYDIHLEANGEPQLDNIRRLWDEPGFAARYALREFQRAQNAAKDLLAFR